MSRTREAVENIIQRRQFLTELGSLRLGVLDALEKFDKDFSERVDLNKIKQGLSEKIPALESGKDILDYSYIAEMFKELCLLGGNDKLPEKFRKACGELDKAFEKADASKVLKATVEGNREMLQEICGENATLADYFLWACVAHVAAPFMPQLKDVVAEASWAESSCPVCGNLPVMAYLEKTDRGREKFLSCGHCGAGWSYARIGCPYCENKDQKTLGIIEVEEEPDIRIDSCEKCRSYIKTYIGRYPNGEELADWASLHMDTLIKDKKYKKHGALLSTD